MCWAGTAAALLERLAHAPDWSARFDVLDAALGARIAASEPVEPVVALAWRRLLESRGRVAISSLTSELGWSRKRLGGRLREHVGLAPE